MEAQGQHVPVTDEAGFAQRRRCPRVRVLKAGTIVFRAGNCSMRCRILDISEGGARLAPADMFLCPREFVLKPDIGASRNCEVKWRNATSIGVQFIE